MSLLAYAICFAAGIATNVIYNNIRTNEKDKAYESGFRQAQREEAIRREAMASKRFQDYFYSTLANNTYTTNPAPRFVPPIQQNTESASKNILQVDESFMNDLRKNGRAAAVRIVK